MACVRCGLFPRALRLFRDGQLDSKQGTALRTVCALDRAIVCGDDALACAQPQACSLAPETDGVVGIKGVLRTGSSQARVRKLQHDSIACAARYQGERAAGFGHGVNRVVQDVQADLQKLVRIPWERWQI